VLCHLDRHAGVTAVQGSRPIWTTFGVAPGDGLPGIDGIGHVDLGVLDALVAAGWTIDRALVHALRTRGGLASIGPVDGLERLAADAGREMEPARTVFETLVQRIVVAAAGAIALLGGLDALVFVGEDALASHRFRHAVCAGLGYFQVALPTDDPLVSGDLTLLSPAAVEPSVFAASVEEVSLVFREVGRLTGARPPGDDPNTARRTLP
jgi:acetate kinase